MGQPLAGAAALLSAGARARPVPAGRKQHGVSTVPPAPLKGIRPRSSALKYRRGGILPGYRLYAQGLLKQKCVTGQFRGHKLRRCFPPVQRSNFILVHRKLVPRFSISPYYPTTPVYRIRWLSASCRESVHADAQVPLSADHPCGTRGHSCSGLVAPRDKCVLALCATRPGRDPSVERLG